MTITAHTPPPAPTSIQQYSSAAYHYVVQHSRKLHSTHGTAQNSIRGQWSAALYRTALLSTVQVQF